FAFLVSSSPAHRVLHSFPTRRSSDLGVGLDLDDRADEPPPVRAVGVPQRRLQRHRHGGRADVDDPHARAHRPASVVSLSGSTTALPAVSAPSILTSAPVTNDARLDSRNSMTSATS